MIEYKGYVWKAFQIVLIQVATIGIYFKGIRPLREVFGHWVETAIFSVTEPYPGYIDTILRNGITINTAYTFRDTELIFSYAPQFGFFFLITIIGLNFFKTAPRVYLTLTGFHLLAEIVALLCSYAALHGLVIGFVIADFILLYLSPLISLGFVLYVFLQKKGKLSVPDE